MTLKENYPKRGKIAIIIILVVFSASIYAFRKYENLSWLDAIYFLTVTLSTTGYGDISPTHPNTKIILIILIITGLATLAILSEITLDKLIKLRLSPNLDLPIKPLEYSKHLVFGGYSPLVQTLISFAEERFFHVVVLDRNIENVKIARLAGIEAYHAEIEQPLILEKLNLANASGMYLFLNDDNLLIQTSILTKELAPELPIFAATDTHFSFEFGEIVGISRTYHDERLLASFINTSNKEIETLLMPNQEVEDSVIRIVYTKDLDPLLKKYPLAKCIGYISSNFTDMEIFHTNSDAQPIDDKCLHIIALSSNDDLTNIETVESVVANRYNRIIIGGWSEKIKHLVQHLIYETPDLLFITFDKEKYEIAEQDGFNIVYCEKLKLAHLVETNITDRDLVVNLFEQISDSLLLTTVIRSSKINPEIMQVVHGVQEVDVFLRIGVNRVISPHLLTARAMFLILLKYLKMPISMIYRNSHLFEYKVVLGDKFINQSISKIEKLGFKIIMWIGEQTVYRSDLNKKEVVREGDHLLVYKQHSLFSRDANRYLKHQDTY